MNFDRKGLLGTISFHSIIALLLIFFGIEFPWPPPEAGGIEVNFGNSEMGLGDMEPSRMKASVSKPLEQPPQKRIEETSAEEDEGILTQDFEKAPAVTTPKVEKKKKPTEVKKEQEQKPQPEVKKVPKEEPLDESELFSFDNNRNTSTSQGITSGSGNQGKEHGTPTSDYYGDGAGSGNQPHHTLSGRKASLKTPSVYSQYPGVVVVTVKVDKNGRVLSAVAGAKGTTITSETIQKEIERAAMASKFDAKDNAPFEQSGEIWYYVNPK